MMVTVPSISCVVVALGVLFILAGLLLVINRKRLAGTLVALLGICLLAVPALLFLYIYLVMR